MKRRRGSILIFVLWVLIILSILSISISYRSSGDIKLAKYESENIKALYLARACIAKMLVELNKDRNNYDSLNEDWNKEREIRLGGGKVAYRAYDEAARFNINSSNLNKKQLIRLGPNDDLCLRIMDYKITKGAKGFEFMEELFLVDGMTRDIYAGIKDYITIYRGADPRININTADEDVLRLLLEDDLIVSKIIEFRKGDDARIGTVDDGVFAEDNFRVIFENFGVAPEAIVNYRPLFSVRSGFFRISLDVSFSEGKTRTRHFASVLDRSGKIYYWRED